MNNIIDDGFNVQNVQRILGVMDKIECKLQAALDYLPADQLGNLKVRADHPQALEIEYCRWMSRLADVFGVTMYPYAKRAQAASGDGGNIRVRHN